MSDDFLENKRNAIGECDREIMALLQRRTDLAAAIGQYKAEHGMEVHNPAQEAKVLERYRTLAEEFGINPDTAETLAKLMIREAIDRENSVQKD